MYFAKVSVLLLVLFISTSYASSGNVSESQNTKNCTKCSQINRTAIWAEIRKDLRTCGQSAAEIKKDLELLFVKCQRENWSHSRAIKEILTCFAPKITQLGKIITSSSTNITSESTRIQKLIESQITQASSSITKEITSITNTIDTISKNSDETCYNITSCLKAQGSLIGKIDLSQIQQCKQIKQIVGLSSNCTELEQLRTEVNQTITTCLHQCNHSARNFKICITTKLSKAEQSLKALETEIENKYSGAKTNATQCITKATAALTETVKNISSKVAQCEKLGQ